MLIQLGHRSLCCGAWLRQHRTLAVKVLKGQATVAGTRQFLMEVPLPLFHQFDKTKLYVNPVIHGAPKKVYKKTDKDIAFIEALTRRAIVKNRSNCVIVYKHNDDGEAWYSTNLEKLFKDPANNVERQQIVMVANIGRPTTRENVFKRLGDACDVTGLEALDMVIIEVGDQELGLP